MIDISKLTETDKDRNVIYHREFCDEQVGKLSSWNDKFIFVRFKGPNGEACEPNDVSFENAASDRQRTPGLTGPKGNPLEGINMKR